MPKMRKTAVRLDTKEINDTGEFEGYGSVFDVVDSYGEVVKEGAFQDSLAEHKKAGTFPALLWQHNPSEPMGVYTEMFEDSRGLFVKGKLALETQRGREAHALLTAGALNGLSIGFYPKRWEYEEESGTRFLTEIDLWEVSVVTFPANSDARISGTKALSAISDLNTLQDAEKYLREEGGFSNNAATAMVGAIRRICDGEREVRRAKAEIMRSSDRLLRVIQES